MGVLRLGERWRRPRLVIGALALLFHISLRWIGMIMAFGAGVLISAVAFDLVEEASKTAHADWPVYLGIFAGCGVFFSGDWLIDRAGGSNRKDPTGAQKDGSALAIVLGSVLDGIPESMVIGLTIYQGGKVGAAYLIAVFISNLPESISSTSGLVAEHRRVRSHLRGGSDPHDALRHDDARGLPARREARRGRHHARLCDRIPYPHTRLSHCVYGAAV